MLSSSLKEYPAPSCNGGVVSLGGNAGTLGQPLRNGGFRPCDKALSQRHRTRETPLIHHGIDGAAAQAGGIDNGGQSQVLLKHVWLHLVGVEHTRKVAKTDALK